MSKIKKSKIEMKEKNGKCCNVIKLKIGTNNT